MNFSSFVPDVLAALTAAAAVALFAWLLSWFRNLNLERGLKRALSPNGVGVRYSLEPLEAEFTIQIHNYTNACIRVRSVLLVAEKCSIELSPSKKNEIFQTPLSNEIMRPKFRRTFLYAGGIEEDNNPHSRILPPKTMAIWEVWPDAIGQHAWNLIHGYIVFEYPTLFGNTAMVRIRMPEACFKLIKESFEELSTCFRERRPLPDPTHRRRA